MNDKAVVAVQNSLEATEQDHGTSLSVENLHFNVLQMLQCASRKFEERTGRPARFFYAPEPFIYLVDIAVREKATANGNPVPEGGVVRNVFGMELVIAPGTCFTVTADDIVKDAYYRKAMHNFDTTGLRGH